MYLHLYSKLYCKAHLSVQPCTYIVSSMAGAVTNVWGFTRAILVMNLLNNSPCYSQWIVKNLPPTMYIWLESLLFWLLVNKANVYHMDL